MHTNISTSVLNFILFWCSNAPYERCAAGSIARGAGHHADRTLAVAPAYDVSFAALRRAARTSGDFWETGMRVTMTDRTGGCACGAIRFKITAPLMGVGVCHCTDCQKASGGGPNYVARAPKTAFEVTKGEARVYFSKGDSGEDVGRAFCPNCGTSLITSFQRCCRSSFLVPIAAGVLCKIIMLSS